MRETRNVDPFLMFISNYFRWLPYVREISLVTHRSTMYYLHSTSMQREAMPTLIAKDLVASSATPLILSILSQGDSYGYDIIQQVKDRSDGLLVWADGMLYPILHRMEKNALIESYWGKAATGRKRKYYTLLDAGRTELSQQQEQWHQLYTLLMSFKGE